MKEYTIIIKQGFCGPSFEITGTLDYLKRRFKLTKDICYIAEKCVTIKEPKTIKALLTALRKRTNMIVLLCTQIVLHILLKNKVTMDFENKSYEICNKFFLSEYKDASYEKVQDLFRAMNEFLNSADW